MISPLFSAAIRQAQTLPNPLVHAFMGLDCRPACEAGFLRPKMTLT